MGADEHMARGTRYGLDLGDPTARPVPICRCLGPGYAMDVFSATRTELVGTKPCPLHRAQGALIESGVPPRTAELAVQRCPPRLAVDPDELLFDLRLVPIEQGWRVAEVARIHPEPVCLACFMHSYRYGGRMTDTCPATGRLMDDCWRPDRPPV